MGRFARVTLALVVWVNLTLTCQGHDVGATHSGVHIALFAHNHSEEEGEAAAELPPASPSTIKTQSCTIGPMSGGPEGDIVTFGAGEELPAPEKLPRLLIHEASSAQVLATQYRVLPEDPPPRDA